MRTITLSEAARVLLQRRLEGERIEVTDESRPLYRELVEAGLMMPLHSFARGSEGAYRLTDAACALRERSAADPTLVHPPEQLPCRLADR